MRRNYAEILTSRRARRPLTPAARLDALLALLAPQEHVVYLMLATGARIADEIDPRLAWHSVGEILDSLARGGLSGEGADDVRLELEPLTRRGAYDRVRRILERLVELNLARVSLAHEEPRAGERVYACSSPT